MTFQPRSLSSDDFNASLVTFFSNFTLQNSELCLGLEGWQFGQRCQKHPLTKIASFLRMKTISGLPGIFFQCNRYPLSPRLHNCFLSKSSGLVFLFLMLLMILERASFTGVGDLLSVVYALGFVKTARLAFSQ